MTSATRLIKSPLDAAIGVVARSRWRLVHYAVLLLIHEYFIASGRHSGDRDWRYVFYPWADALRLSILKYHEFPWWNPWSLSGQPLFADPQTAVFMPDTLLIALFGAVVGLKVVIVLYFFVGYEGSRFLCRELFGPSRFVESISIIPALVAPLALHFSVGHVVFVTFFFFPWLLALALSWQRSAGRSVAFGFVIGCVLLSYIHYVVIIAGTLLAPIVLLGFWRGAAKRETWAKAALVGCTALGMSFARLCLTLDIVRRFPRTETLHYPLSYSLGGVVGTLVDPLQDRNNEIQVAGLGWWEIGCYVGVCALFLAYEGFRRNERRFWPLYGAAVLCLVLAWNNRDPWFPSYWLHFVRPYQYMLVITRWRLFGCFFLLLGAVHGLVGIRMRGRARLAGALAVFVVIDLGFAISYAYRGMFALSEPPFGAASAAPRTVFDTEEQAWPDLRANLVSDGAECTLLGYGHHYPKRVHVGSPGYAGDFFGKSPVNVESWTPNRIVLRGTPGDTVTLNVNPSNYWLMNGERLFPTYRPFETDLPFSVKVPSGGRMEFVPRPPHWQGLFLVQGAFAVLAFALFRHESRRFVKGCAAMSRPILVTQQFNAPAERVFAALDDNTTMGRWLGVKVDVIESPPDKGVGTVRRLHIGLQKIDEEILEREVPRRIAYKIVRGLFPLSYHRGEINVTSLSPQRSSAEWRIELESKIPGLGTLVRAGLGLGIKRALKKLAGQLGG